MTFNVVQRSLLEKLAQDNGFDVPAEMSAVWLAFSSTQVPLKLWMATAGESWCVAFSAANVAAELANLTSATGVPPPAGAAAARQVADLGQLHRVVRRAYQLSSTLPDELLHQFERQTRDLPQTTEIERLVIQRVGQDLFREGLMRYWDSQCAVTGLREPELLRASHIKGWAHCVSGHERLNIYNGLLLAVHLDAAFDRGFITFDDDGRVVISPRLSRDDCKRLGLQPDLSLQKIEGGHRAALAWHRANCFRGQTLASGGEE